MMTNAEREWAQRLHADRAGLMDQLEWAREQPPSMIESFPGVEDLSLTRVADLESDLSDVEDELRRLGVKLS